MFRLTMLHSIHKEHAARSAASRGCLGGFRHGLLLPVARCVSHANWLPSSAAESRQVSGSEMLSHVAAEHGIAAHSHGVRQQSCHRPAAIITDTCLAKPVSQQLEQQAKRLCSMHFACKASSRFEAPTSTWEPAAKPLPPAVHAASAACLDTLGLVTSDLNQGRRSRSALSKQALCQTSSVGASSSSTSAAAATGRMHFAVANGQTLPMPDGVHTPPLLATPATAAGFGTGWAEQQQQHASRRFNIDSSSRYYQGGRRKSASEMLDEEKFEALIEKVGQTWAASAPGWDASSLSDLIPGPNRGSVTCPVCSNGSKGENCFLVTVESDIVKWYCHRASCNFQGVVKLDSSPDSSSSSAAAAVHKSALSAPAQGSVATPVSSIPAPLGHESKQEHETPGSSFQPLSTELLAWFQRRGISEEVLQRNRIAMEMRLPNIPYIAFPFYRNGRIVNVKYRALEKHFLQLKGGEQIFYGYDDAKGATELIIVEGEMDKLSVEEALTVAARGKIQQQQQHDGDSSSLAATADGGNTSSSAMMEERLWWRLGRRTAVLSVPAGAGSASAEAKLKYLDTCKNLLDAAQRVVIAVDNDGAGLALAEELLRRIGRAKCWKVTWPTDASGGNGSSLFRKDANEVLVADGPEVLLQYIDSAQQLPITGLFHLSKYWEEVFDLHRLGAGGRNSGLSTGWESLDTYYKVVPGELTLVTGYPGSGKSEWLDALTVNLAKAHDWVVALCSLENRPKQHAIKLIEKYVGLPFSESRISHGKTPMSQDQMLNGLIWVDEHFHIIQRPKDTSPDIDYILDRARAAVMRYGINGLVIDPYNELNHSRPLTVTETEHVSKMLTKIKRFAQAHECHVWLVAHPRTVHAGSGQTPPPPTLYDMSGSAHFINKADNGVVVHRPWVPGQEGGDPNMAQLLVRKVRNKLAGGIGECHLRYEPATGLYMDDVDQNQD